MSHYLGLYTRNEVAIIAILLGELGAAMTAIYAETDLQRTA